MYKKVIKRVINYLGYELIKKPCDSVSLSKVDMSLSEADMSLSEADMSLSKADMSLSEVDMSLSEADREIISIAKTNYYNSSASKSDSNQPPYGTRWAPQVEVIKVAIEGFLDPIQCIHFAQLHITFDHRESDGFVTDLPRIKLYDALLKQEFPFFKEELDALAENPLSYPSSIVQYRGRAVSNVFFLHAWFILACSSYIQSPKRILEIGGGYGAPARLWMHTKTTNIESYSIVDIPECLFFAEVALRKEFGNEAVGYFDGKDPGTRIVLVPLCHLGVFKRKSDLVINTGSMQEMTDEWVDYYKKWLNDYGAKYFYSLNYAAQPLENMVESRNLWSPRLGTEWSTLRLNINMPLIRAQGPSNDFLEAMYKKTPAQGKFEKWAYFHGKSLTKQTYIEGIDLLRQNLNTEDALKFVNLVLTDLPYIPKEVLWIINYLEKNGCNEIIPIKHKLDALKGGYVNPY